MTISEARAAVEKFDRERAEIYGERVVGYFSYEEVVQLLYEIGNYYIHIESLLGEDTIITTMETRIIIVHFLLTRQHQHPNLWTLANLREAVSRMLDDNEFKVFMVKHEG